MGPGQTCQRGDVAFCSTGLAVKVWLHVHLSDATGSCLVEFLGATWSHKAPTNSNAEFVGSVLISLACILARMLVTL